MSVSESEDEELCDECLADQEFGLARVRRCGWCGMCPHNCPCPQNEQAKEGA